jgi:hypothetical protein
MTSATPVIVTVTLSDPVSPSTIARDFDELFQRSSQHEKKTKNENENHRARDEYDSTSSFHRSKRRGRPNEQECIMQ